MTEHVTEHKHGGLKELPATAICGNDITSSCLYVSALAIVYGGKWAPLALLCVGGVLYLFRSIYAEVVGALPLNGGAYNALLNTTSKFRASIAACLTILSYMATAVISASEAMHYVETLVHGLNVAWATAGLLAVFAVLTIVGITESAIVAIVIFITHIATLVLLIFCGVIFLFGNGLSIAAENFAAAPPGGFGTALLFGFSAAMLGISGFESSSNFVEEQAEGVFPKTLRNMWVAVTFFNPVMALLALSLISIDDVHANEHALLAHLGEVSAGKWLSYVISVDAALVLSGAVLTSFVGVNGLVGRMTLDRCLPQLLLKRNRRGTTHRIVIAFFILCVSVLFVTSGDDQIKKLAVVYTLSFLSVMALFGFGNILLKVKRARLPRPARAPWAFVLVAIAAVMVAIYGNARMKEEYLRVFLFYLIPALLVVSIMLSRISILKGVLFIARGILKRAGKRESGLEAAIQAKIDDINSQQLVFFTRGDNVANLNQAMLYVSNNEHTNRIKIVSVVKDEGEVPERLRRDLRFLDEAYPEIDIEFVVEKGTFGPELIQELSRRWQIPTNLMFIGSPGTHFMYGLAELGGVRLII